jgi:hypothetical protein
MRLSRFYPQAIGICARMAELVDAPASGAGARKGVEVRVLFRAPVFYSAMFAEGCKTPEFLP